MTTFMFSIYYIGTFMCCVIINLFYFLKKLNIEYIYIVLHLLTVILKSIMKYNLSCANHYCI